MICVVRRGKKTIARTTFQTAARRARLIFKERGDNDREETNYNNTLTPIVHCLDSPIRGSRTRVRVYYLHRVVFLKRRILHKRPRPV